MTQANGIFGCSKRGYKSIYTKKEYFRTSLRYALTNNETKRYPRAPKSMWEVKKDYDTFLAPVEFWR